MFLDRKRGRCDEKESKQGHMTWTRRCPIRATVNVCRYAVHCNILSLITIDRMLSSTSVFGYIVVGAFVNESFTMVVAFGEPRGTKGGVTF